MVAQATLAELADIEDPINGIGDVGGEVVRDRWNQYAMVEVTDHPDLDDPDDLPIFVNKSMHNVWRLAKAKLGTAKGDWTGPDFVIPLDQTT